MMQNDSPQSNRTVIWKNPYFLIAMAAVGYWVYTYHWEHALGYLPYAILLLCPLMHVFMHKGHGQGDNCHENETNHSEIGYSEQKNTHQEEPK